MPQTFRIYVPDATKDVLTIDLGGPDAKMIQSVLRKNVGDPLTVLNGRGDVFSTQIKQLEKNNVRLSVLQHNYIDLPKPTVAVTVGVLKGEKNLLVTQKLTELGIDDISFVHVKHSIGKIHEKKLNKHKATIIEAMRQSGNPHMPSLKVYKDMEECMQDHAEKEKKICFHEKEKSLGFKHMNSADFSSFHILIGPEGGFADFEAELFEEKDYALMRCAPYVLRAETAAILAGSVLRACSKDVT